MFFKRILSGIRSVSGLFVRTPLLQLIIVFLSFAGAFLLISWQGIGLTHDSGIYVLSVETLWDKGVMLDHTGQVLKLYPPLYIWLLALYRYTFLSLYGWAAFLNALAYSLTLFFSLRLAMLWLRDLKWMGLACLWIVFSVPLFINAYFLWSEIIFIALLSAILYLTCFYIRNSKTYWMLTGMSLLSVLAIMQRYIGVFLVISIFIFLLFHLSRILGRLKAILVSSVYALPPALFFIGWMYRNYLLTGRTNSYDDWYTVSPWENLREALISLATFFIPDELPSSVLLISSVALIVLVIYAVIKDQSETRFVGQLLLLFFFSYLILFVGLNSILYIGPLDDRYMSPLYAPLVLLTIRTMIFFTRESRNSSRPFYLYPCYGFLALISLYLTVRFGKNAIDWSQSGSGYQSESWKANEMVRYLKKEDASTLILSNNPMPFILLNGQESYAPVQPLSAYRIPDKTLYVRWGEDKALGYLRMNRDLWNANKYRLESIKAFEDGEVYRIYSVK